MVKLVILVIDSDDDPIYQTGRLIWRRNAEQHGARVFFLNALPSITDDSLLLDQDLLCTKWIDAFEHRLNDKTLKSLQYCHEYLDFDYVLRTNLSSFYRLDALMAYLAVAARQQFYAGPINSLPIEGTMGDTFEYISGSGILLSRDLVSLALRRKNAIPRYHVDDIWMGLALRDIPRSSVPRCDFEDISNLGADKIFRIVERIQEADSRQVFHFRVKNRGEFPRFVLDSLVFGMLAEKYLS